MNFVVLLPFFAGCVGAGLILAIYHFFNAPVPGLDVPLKRGPTLSSPPLSTDVVELRKQVESLQHELRVFKPFAHLIDDMRALELAPALSVETYDRDNSDVLCSSCVAFKTKRGEYEGGKGSSKCKCKCGETVQLIAFVMKKGK